MITPPFTPEELSRLEKPTSWENLAQESPLITRQKIERAKQLNVLAVLFTAEQVSKRVTELATLEHAKRNGTLDDTVYAVLMRGGIQFATPFFTHMATLSPNMNPSVE